MTAMHGNVQTRDEPEGIHMGSIFGIVFGGFSTLFFVLLIKGILADAYGVGTAPKITIREGLSDDPGAIVREHAYIAYPVMFVIAVVFGVVAWVAFTS
jgi:hypothetical protein